MVVCKEICGNLRQEKLFGNLYNALGTRIYEKNSIMAYIAQSAFNIHFKLFKDELVLLICSTVSSCVILYFILFFPLKFSNLWMDYT